MTGSICDCNAPYTFGHRADCHLADFPVQATHVGEHISRPVLKHRLGVIFAGGDLPAITDPHELAAEITARVFQER